MSALNLNSVEKPLYFTKSSECWNIALIDDDPDFRNLMDTMTSGCDVKITGYPSLSSFPSLKQLKNFDVIMLDYYLDKINGVQVAQYINSFFPKIPVILVSGGFIYNDTDVWPSCIKAFLPKNMGASAMIDETLAILQKINRSNH